MQSNTIFQRKGLPLCRLMRTGTKTKAVDIQRLYMNYSKTMWTFYATNSSIGIFLWVVVSELRQDAVGSSFL